MPRRSVLFSPGDRPELLRKAPGAGADVVVFDLEDAVSPDRKAEAREAVSRYSRTCSSTATSACVQAREVTHRLVSVADDPVPRVAPAS